MKCDKCGQDLPEDKERDEIGKTARDVFEYWQQRAGHPRAVWSPQRRRLLEARLREEPGDMADKAAGLRLAVDGAVESPWFNGSENGTSYLDFDNIFRNKGRDRIEKLQRLAREPKREKLADDPDVRAFLGAGKDQP